MAATTSTTRSGVAFAGIAGLAAGALLIVLLALIPPTDEISVTRQTISQYGLTDGKWVFNLAVLLVAAGSALILWWLRWQGRLPTSALILGTLWTLSLLVIVAFPKANWATVTGFSLGGTVHRGASLVGFGCLPFAVLAAARTAFPDSPGRRFTARLFAVLSLAWFGAILVAVLVAAVSDQHWWQLIPLGAVERGMAITDLIALTVLALPTVPDRALTETAAAVVG
ncbi:MAG TPA: DUF998 domain-containing protein [Pseudonocardiaceae bacterium]|jgi:hypothetical protein|nr:DUF998 domain-containing protein [Pseudonocardiaceae bacterium]